MSKYRTESDSLGPVKIPQAAAWGSQTQRALENFPITGVSISHYPELITGLASVKKACALANRDLGAVPAGKAAAIAGICDEIISGRHHDHFVVDVMQGGAGTSTNMNTNEVIANLALKKLGADFGTYGRLHPNDDVNRSQSTNDVYPTAIRLAVLSRITPLIEAMHGLTISFGNKASEFQHIMKVGRTQLQDAVPMPLGAEFRGYATTINEDADRLRDLSRLLTEVNLGGTAIGTGINAPANFGEAAVVHLREITGEPLQLAPDLIEASSDLGAFVMFSSTLKRVGIKLSKICNDLRLMSSGPRAGIGEIILPAVQAGSSIMPGKVNPVIPEVVNQVCYQAIGNDLTVTMAAEAGQFQLNAMEPVIIHKVLETMGSLTSAMNVLRTRCVDGIIADEERCQFLLSNSLVQVTTLAPVIGYEAATKLAKYAQANGLCLQSAALPALPEELAETALKHLQGRIPENA
ncbi:aspartate ammonia-lyase [Leisingera sp. SS27]|uniref:aspartate ammonia-lyase n=1 Tax=Leisingera sp. SS27 TaxID=2979462 RepID=UPI00232DBA5A|nr:aspartate ammonia-lyase [Leisingera sp. SS27]MDC0658873.1 aspartate ammonia-lyase [Leisingera sp. SS27]